MAVDRLNTMTTAATAAENSYIKEAAKTDCRSDLLNRTFAGTGAGADIDVQTPCKVFADKDLLAKYDALLKGVNAYTAAMQAEAVAGTTKNLDDATKNLAGEFGAAAKTDGVLEDVGAGGGPITTAAIGIVDWVLARHTYATTTAAAAAQKENLRTIVDALKKVNQAIQRQLSDEVMAHAHNAQALVKATSTQDPAVAFVVRWQVMTIFNLTPEGGLGSEVDIKALGNRLDALVRCNDAIAAGGANPEKACATSDFTASKPQKAQP